MLANSYSFLSDFGQVQKEHGYSDEGMLMSIIELQKKNRGRGDKYFNAFVTFAIVSVAMFVVGAFVALDAIT